MEALKQAKSILSGAKSIRYLKNSYLPNEEKTKSQVKKP